MSQVTQGRTKSFIAGAALTTAYARVKLSAGKVVLAGAGEAHIGFLEGGVNVVSGGHVTVVLASAQGTTKAIAYGSGSVGDSIYGAASGRVSTTANGAAIGIALETWTATGDVIEVLQSRAYSSANLSMTYGEILSGGIEQGTREQSATQNYALGTKRIYSDGRIFRYIKARTALHSEFGAAYAAKTVTNAVAPTQATGAGDAGDSAVTMTVAAGDGLAGNGAIALNELVGGYVVIANGANQHPQNRLIIGNTAVTAGGGVCTLTLDEALDTAVVETTTNIETLMNPWILSDGNVTNSAYVTFRGMPARELTIDYFGWIQTAGPCWITSDGNTCNSAGDRQIYFASNGSVVSGNDVTGDVNVMQLAGHAVDMSGNGASNAPFVNLCLETTA